MLSGNQLFIWQVFQTGPGNVCEKVVNVQRQLSHYSGLMDISVRIEDYVTDFIY